MQTEKNMIGSRVSKNTNSVCITFIIDHLVLTLPSSHPSLSQAQLAQKTTLLSEARLKEQWFVERVSVWPRMCSSQGQVKSKAN